MGSNIPHLIGSLPAVLLFTVIAVSLVVLAKGADLLVNEAVTLSLSWGVPKMLIGATIVSLGTTLPEAAVSVLAAVRGSPGLALGNAVGSIIADTGLILGLTLLIGPIPVEQRLLRKQSWIQFGSAVLLVAACVPVWRMTSVLYEGGRLPQVAGVLFLGLLVLYIRQTVRWTRTTSSEESVYDVPEANGAVPSRSWPTFLKLVAGIGLVVVSSHVLIPAVQEAALRVRVPESIIAATLVAFGTSLPELVTAITAARKGHGELALGNVLGADVLNVLFVSGASAAATSGGLLVPPQFFFLFFPSMIFVVLVLRIGIARSRTELRRGFGVVLVGAYLVTVISSYLITGTSGI